MHAAAPGAGRSARAGRLRLPAARRARAGVHLAVHQRADTSSLGNELKRNLALAGRTADRGATPPRCTTAQAVLDILAEQREKTVVGVNATGQVREFQLRVRIRFRLRTPQGKELIPDTELLQQRDISFNESAVLAKEAEESLMYRDMQTDIVQQLMRRLAAVKL
jgi:LPS-assembly lipoprotein